MPLPQLRVQTHSPERVEPTRQIHCEGAACTRAEEAAEDAAEPACRKLRVWGLSGEELATLDVGELSDVRALKHHLRRIYGFPVCLQQLLHGETTLLDAAKLSKPMDIQLILGSGKASLEEKSDDLMFSAGGHVETLRMLLKAGVAVDIADRFGNTALMRASHRGQVEVVRLLLAAGANQTLYDMNGSTALIRAAGEGHGDVVRLLLAAAAEKGLGHDRLDGGSALICAAFNYHVDIVWLLLEAGVDANYADRQGNTAIKLLPDADIPGWLAARTDRSGGADSTTA